MFKYLLDDSLVEVTVVDEVISLYGSWKVDYLATCWAF